MLFSLFVIYTQMHLKILFIKRLCSVAIKISKLLHIEFKTSVFKTSVSCFLVFSSLVNIVRWKCVFKVRKRLLFSFFIINQYCVANVCFSTINVFKTIYRQLLSLLSYFLCYEKCMFKTSAGLLFQFIKLLFLIREIHVKNKWDLLKIFLLQIL